MRRIVAIVGASGSGKTTLVKKLVKKWPQFFKEAVSDTTRPPREGEVDGVDYHFVSKESFFNRLLAGEYVENTEFGGNLYAVRESELISDKITLIVIEPNGLKQLLEWGKRRGDTDIKVVYMDIPDEVRIANMAASRGFSAALERANDGIKDAWKKSGIKEDLKIKKLTNHLEWKIARLLELKELSDPKRIEAWKNGRLNISKSEIELYFLSLETEAA